MDKIIDEFQDSVIMHDEMCLFLASKGIEVIERCRQMNREIYFIEAFKLTDHTIQPFMDYSIDFPRNKNREGQDCDGNWDVAKEFLANLVDTDFVFEIFYEGYGDESSGRPNGSRHTGHDVQ